MTTLSYLFWIIIIALAGVILIALQIAIFFFLIMLLIPKKNFNGNSADEN
jgi:hypothetical protein